GSSSKNTRSRKRGLPRQGFGKMIARLHEELGVYEGSREFHQPKGHRKRHGKITLRYAEIVPLVVVIGSCGGFLLFWRNAAVQMDRMELTEDRRPQPLG